MLLALFGGAGVFSRAAAQAPLIEYTTAGNINKAYGTGAFVLKVTFAGNCTGTQVAVELPVGVTYAGGLATTANTSPGSIGITHNTGASTPGRPVFDVSGAIASGSVLEFTFNRAADCDAVQGSAFDKAFVTFTGGCANASIEALTDNGAKGYNINEPALSVSQPAPLTNQLVGNTFSRTVTVTNGGLGPAEMLYFSITYPGGALVNTAAGAVTVVSGTGSGTFSPVSSSGDTYYYEISGAALFNGNPLLENGEAVQITEPLGIAQCGTPNITTSYAASWGMAANNLCQTAANTSQVSFAAGAANFTAATVQRNNFTNTCNTFELAFTVTNGGGGNSTAAGMYNLNIRHGNHSSNVLSGPYNVDWRLFEYSNVKIGGVTVPDGRVTLVPGAVIDGSTSTVQNIDLSDLFSINDYTEGPGGLEDLDGDGFFDDLAGGKVLSFTMDVTMKDLSCGNRPMHHGHGLKLYYDDMCGAAKVSDTRAASGSGIVILGSSNGIAHVPANVIGGEVITFSAKAAWSQLSYSLVNSNTRWRWKIELPAGFTVAGTPNARYGTNPVNNGTGQGEWTQSGNTIIFTSSTALTQTSIAENFYIDLKFDCNPPAVTGGLKTFNYYLEQVNDITSPECMRQGRLVCETVVTEAKCPEPCTGISPGKPVVRRTTLGFTDNTMTARQIRANISSYDLSKALYLDEIEIEAGATIGSGFTTSNLYIHLDLPKTTLSPIGQDKLTPSKVDVEIVRGGNVIGTYTATTADQSAGTPTSQVILWDLTAALNAGTVGGSLAAGDVINTKSYYKVATNAGLPLQDIQSGGRWYFYALDTNDEEIGVCDSWVPEMYLVGTQTDNGTNAFNTIGCNTTVIGGNTWNLARRMAGAGQQFETEFRPAFYIDYIEIDMPLTYVLNSVDFIANNPYWRNNSLGTGTSLPGLTPSATSGSLRTYTNPNDGSWKVFNITTVNTYGGVFNTQITPTCATEATSQTNVKVHIRDFYYAYAEVGGATTPTAAPAGFSYVLRGNSNRANEGNLEPAGQNRVISYSNTGRPTLVMQNLTGTVNATAAEHEWTVSIGNTGTSNAPYTWIAIPDHTGITVTEVRRADNSVVMPIAYSGGKMYHLEETPGIPQGQTRNYHIRFAYSSCDPATLKVLAGWNCGSYPADPTQYVCYKSEIDLEVAPQQSQVQLVVNRQPGSAAGEGEVEMCGQVFTDIILNSAQAAYLINPYIEFNAPAGVSLPSTVSVEYPLGSTAQNLPLTNVSGNLYRINLSAHSGIGSAGIPGTADAANNAARQAKVTIGLFEISCDFSSGTTFRFRGYGNRPCGSPAFQNGVTVATDPLYIEGVARTGAASLQLSFGTVESISCDEEITLSSEIMPVGAASEAGDFIEYTLPAGLEYVAGSMTSGFTATVTGNKVRVNMPVTAANTPAGFAFDLKATAGGDFCGDVQVFADYHRVVEGLTCGTETCEGSSRVIGNGSSGEIAIRKPDLRIDNVVVTGGASSPGHSYTVDMTLTNTGSVDAPAAAYVVEVFCGSSTTPFDAQTFSAAVTAGAAATAPVTFTVPAAPACNSGDNVIYRIRPVTEEEEVQCLCGPAEFTSEDPLPVALASFGAVKTGEGAALLTWTTTEELNSDKFVVLQSTDGTNWLAIGEVAAGRAGNPDRSYSFTDREPYKGVNYYRLKIVDLDGSFELSNIRSLAFEGRPAKLKLYPNPASDYLQVVSESRENISKAEMFDTNGRLALVDTQMKSGKRLDIKGLAAGTYVLRITLDNGAVEVRKVVIGSSRR